MGKHTLQTMANKGFFAVNAGISAHSWNHDMSKLALSPNNQELYIYDTSAKDVVPEKVYNEQHLQTITSVDWSPVTNLIVTSSQDRTAQCGDSMTHLASGSRRCVF